MARDLAVLAEHELILEAWAQGARLATEAMQRMIETAAQAAATSAESLQNAASTSSLSAAETATQPQQAMEGLMAGIGQAISQLSALQTHFLKSLLEGLPEASKRHLDAQCFSPLERLASANWEEELRRQGRGELVGTDDYRYVSIEGAHVTIMIDPRTKPIWGQMSDFLLGEEVPTSEAC